MKRILVFLSVILFGLVILFLWGENGLRPVDVSKNSPPLDVAEKLFVIEKGKGIREIASDLKKESLIRDPIVFFLYVKLNGHDRDIQAGDYHLSPSMDLRKLVDTLSHGTIDFWVTIPEGLRGEEVAEIFKNHFGEYDNSWQRIFIDNNGYLFPDTYLIPKNADVNLIIKLMKNNFYKKINDVHISTDTARLNTIVIIASLIEREARFPEDRPLVSSVIANRLQTGMKLDIDATVQYALSFQKDQNSWWKKNLTHEDLKINSPYNTYVAAGLPPAPICNPGISSLNAAANPAQTDYFYYVSDKEGHLHFAKTVSEHNKNVGQYIEK